MIQEILNGKKFKIPKNNSKIINYFKQNNYLCRLIWKMRNK